MKTGSSADQAGELALWVMGGIVFLALFLISSLTCLFTGFTPDDGYGAS